MALKAFSSGLFGVFLLLILFLLLPLILENIALCGASYSRSTRKQQSSTAVPGSLSFQVPSDQRVLRVLCSSI